MEFLSFLRQGFRGRFFHQGQGLLPKHLATAGAQVGRGIQSLRQDRRQGHFGARRGFLLRFRPPPDRLDQKG